MSCMTPEALRAWARTAKPGETLVYHTGQRVGGANLSSKSPRSLLFKAARELFAAGQVALLQRPLFSETTFEFTATRISPKTAERLDRLSLSIW